MSHLSSESLLVLIGRIIVEEGGDKLLIVQVTIDDFKNDCVSIRRRGKGFGEVLMKFKEDDLEDKKITEGTIREKISILIKACYAEHEGSSEIYSAR